MNAQTLAASLDRPAGFAAVMRGMFRNGKAKKAHAVWETASARGVHATEELRFVTHQSFGFAVLAFATDGPLDEAVRDRLAAQAERFPLATIRYESVSYSALTPLHWHPHAYAPGDHAVEALGDPYPGVHVFVAVTSPKGPDRPYVAHCVADGRDWIYPIPGDRLC